MKTTIKYFSLGLVAVLGLSACSDKFLEEKKDYETTGQSVYDYYEGALGRLADLYSFGLPGVENMNWRYPSAGRRDDAGMSTEEYTGFSDFVNPEITMSSMSSTNAVKDYYDGGGTDNVQNKPWGIIRNINNFIEGVEGSTLNDEQKNLLLGQAYFFRAWAYFKLVKWYGGVPIVKKVIDVSGDFVPRSSAKECFAFIIEDLDKSAVLLEPFTDKLEYGRITAGTALAMKGRVLTWWCSPLFNRAKDPDRIQEAYTIMKADMTKLQNNYGYGLYGEINPGTNGAAFANMFATYGRNPEAVFFTLYNTITDFSGYADKVKQNPWETAVRPGNTGGSGMSASKTMVDLFPMADGKMPKGYTAYSKLENSTADYDDRYPFMNRDPRFYRTFTFPGFRWAYTTNSIDDATKMDPHNPSYDGGANYSLWNYVWFYEGNRLDENNSSYRGADNLAKPSGVFILKKSDDADVNEAVYEYRPDGQGTGNAENKIPFCSAATYMELRFTEVLMNYAEIACLAGHTDEAYAILKRIRQRVGYTGDCGLTIGDQQTCMSAILYERQIEFAYEGKRFDDMRRWMLYDGGATLPTGAPESWRPSGWGNNTCEWLGFKKFNGQRRGTFIYQVAKDYEVKKELDAYDQDPIKDVERPKGIDLRQDLTDQLNTLKDWYEANLSMQVRHGDPYDSNNTPLYINFRPQYYLLGFKEGVSAHNKGLEQTIGWEDVNNGGAMGTFDPLAE